MRKILILMVLFFSVTTLFAQTAKIKGNVKTVDGESLPGATVVVKGTTNGASTDMNGNFEVQANSSDTLVISYIGFESEEVAVGNQTSIQTMLRLSAEEIKEVVITALGIAKEKTTIGYAVQDVSGENINRAKTGNVLSAITINKVIPTIGVARTCIQAVA